VEPEEPAIDGRSPTHYYGRMTHSARTLALLFALIGALSLPAQSVRDIENIMDLSTTIKSLAQRIEREEYEAPARFVILNGSLEGVFETDEAASTVVVEMVTGEWIGLEDVKSYHCLVRFEGQEYLAAFPAAPPRDPGPEVFARSARMLVVAKPVAVVELGDGRLLWLLDGVYLRRI
jgi:hypothetical protein